MTDEVVTTFKGPGQWRSQAKRLEDGDEGLIVPDPDDPTLDEEP